MDAPHGSVRAAPTGRFAPTRAAASPRAGRDDLHRSHRLADVADDAARAAAAADAADEADEADRADWRAVATFGAGLSVTTLHANGDGVITAATVSVPGKAKPGATGITLKGAKSGAEVEQAFTVTKAN